MMYPDIMGQLHDEEFDATGGNVPYAGECPTLCDCSYADWGDGMGEAGL